MSLKTKLAATVPFAHLLGIRAESDNDDKERKDDARAESDDDERKQREGESDEDYAKRMKALDDDEDVDAEAEEGEEKAEGDDEKEKAAKASERARCAKIIAHGIKHGCAEQAGVFAFDTDMSPAQAIAAMSAAASVSPQGRASLQQRMSNVRVPNVGTDGGAAPDMSDPKSAAKATADRIIAAAAKARGEK